MVVSIFGIDLEIDVYDVDEYEMLEKAVKTVNDKVNGQENPAMTTAEKLRYQCSVVKEFFDTVFGTGTAENLFHGKNNIRDCSEAYLAVIEATGTAMNDYVDSVGRKQVEIAQKYAPIEDGPAQVNPFGGTAQHMNRSQRRKNHKNKNH